MVRVIIHSMFVVLVKRKGIKQAGHNGVGYGLTIAKHYRSVREKAGEAVKSSEKSVTTQAKPQAKRSSGSPNSLLRIRVAVYVGSLGKPIKAMVIH